MMIKMNINYKTEGKGFPILLIHGFSDDLNFWNILSPILTKYYQIISMDLRGHGNTSEGEDSFSIELFQDDIYNLLLELNIHQCHIIGFSLGGNIALKFTLNHPEKVKSLILLSTYGRFDLALENKFKKLKKSLNKGFEEFYEEIIPYVLPEDFIEENKESLDKIKVEKAKIANLSALNKTIIAGCQFNVYNDLEKIDKPCLIIYGEDDDLTPKKLSEELHHKIKGSKLESIPKTKHNLLLPKNIDYISELILDFY